MGVSCIPIFLDHSKQSLACFQMFLLPFAVSCCYWILNRLMDWGSFAFAPVSQCVCWADCRAGRRVCTLSPGRMPTTASTGSQTASVSCSKSRLSWQFCHSV